jgi:hypothetical protein
MRENDYLLLLIIKNKINIMNHKVNDRKKFPKKFQ